MSYFSYSTNYQGVVDVFKRDPDRYLPFAHLLEGIMNGKSELSIPQREKIALHISKLNGCHYCIGSHTAVLSGLSADEAGTVTDTDPRMSAVLAFAAKLTQNPGAMAQTDVDALLQVGWSEQTAEDVIGVVSLFAFLNRLVDGFGIQGSDESFAQAGGMIAQHGYGPLVQLIQEKAAT